MMNEMKFKTHLKAYLYEGFYPKKCSLIKPWEHLPIIIFIVNSTIPSSRQALKNLTAHRIEFLSVPALFRIFLNKKGKNFNYKIIG